MTTTPHPMVEKADALLTTAAVLVQKKWQRRGEGVKPYGIPEALAEAGSGVALIIAERQCVTYGLDVWWNDLLCIDGDDAANELMKLTGIQGDALYGPMWEANLGLLALAEGLSASQLNGLSNVVGSAEWAEFDRCMGMAAAYERDLLLANLCADIHFACSPQPTSPAGVLRKLRGVRALECVAAHHVLMDVLPLESKAILVGPVSKMLLPIDPAY